jgi:hypothetical protein
VGSLASGRFAELIRLWTALFPRCCRVCINELNHLDPPSD